MTQVLPLAQLQSTATDALRRYPTAEASEATALLRTVAHAFVGAREHFDTKTGEVDWLGQTHAYRTWVRETVSAANLPRDDVTTVQNAIRYHVGNALRERLDAETLTALGLRAISPRERSVEKRVGQSALLSLFQGGPRITDETTLDAALEAIMRALHRFDLHDLTRAERGRVRVKLADVATAATLVAEKGSVPRT